jgi:hypothetical protein
MFYTPNQDRTEAFSYSKYFSLYFLIATHTTANDLIVDSLLQRFSDCGTRTP